MCAKLAFLKEMSKKVVTFSSKSPKIANVLYPRIIALFW